MDHGVGVFINPSFSGLSPMVTAYLFANFRQCASPSQLLLIYTLKKNTTVIEERHLWRPPGALCPIGSQSSAASNSSPDVQCKSVRSR